MVNIKRLNQVGDTIVEVLLAVVVISLAIGIGYSIASRSLNTVRQAQERTEAVKQVENQIERLKKLAATDNCSGPSSALCQPSSFCLGDNNQIISISPTPTNIASDPLTSVAYGSGACLKNNLYYVSITPEGGSPPRQYQVRARWLGLNNQKQETVVTYRIYPAT